MPKWIFALIQFSPLSLFATYAFWHGEPDEQRWREAFQLSAVVAVIQLLIVLPQSRPANRLVLAANLYVMFGGLAFMTHQWWFLKLYDSLRESAIFIVMLCVGAMAMLFTKAGYAALSDAPRGTTTRASLWLLGATLLALGTSVLFRGDQTLAAVIPIIALAVLQRFLVYRAGRPSQSLSDN